MSGRRWVCLEMSGLNSCRNAVTICDPWNHFYYTHWNPSQKKPFQTYFDEQTTFCNLWTLGTDLNAPCYITQYPSNMKYSLGVCAQVVGKIQIHGFWKSALGSFHHSIDLMLDISRWENKQIYWRKIGLDSMNWSISRYFPRKQW